MGLKLNQLRDFLAVARHGSIRAAARELKVGQPNLTKSIQSLEHDLGAPLFMRSSTGAVLTLQGKAFLPRVELIMEELRRGQSSVAQLTDEAACQVTMGMCPASCSLFLADTVRVYRRRYPSAPLRIVEDGHSLSLLRNGELDLLVGPEPLPGCRDEIVAERLLELACVVYCHEESPWRHARRLFELQDAMWIRPAIFGRPSAEFDATFATRQMPPPRNLVDVDSTFAGAQLMEKLDALCIAPRTFAPTLGRPFVPIALEDQLPALPLSLIYSSGLPLTPAADFVANQVRRQALALSRSLAPGSLRVAA